MFIIDREQCIKCGTCESVCINHALKVTEEQVEHDPGRCMWCGHCLAVCPRDAIMIDGDGYDIEDVEEFNQLTRPTVQQIRRQVMMRRSVRSFTEEEVTEKELEYILEAAKYAPTSKNSQDNLLLVVKDPENRRALLERSMELLGELGKKCADTDPGRSAFYFFKQKMYQEKGEDGLFYNAPVIIYVFSDNDIDGSICADTMMQMISAQRGLGSVYLRLAADPFNFDPEMYKEYEIPEGKKCVIAIALGHTEVEFFSSVPRKKVPTVWR